MSNPRTPLRMYLSRDGDMNVKCDPQLMQRALQHRIQKQLIHPPDFYRNITVWKLVREDGTVEYYPRENDSNEQGLEKSVQARVDTGMTRKEAREAAGEYPTNSGIHSEVNVVAEIYRRSDVLSGRTRVEQVFTERMPCGACQTFMRNMFPKVLYTPFFYYVQPFGTERRFQLKPYDGSFMNFLLHCYGA